MRSLFLPYLVLGLVVSSLSFETAHAKKQDKVIMCHIPKGDISKAKEIIVSQKAFEKHLLRGKTKGLCGFIDPTTGSGDDNASGSSAEGGGSDPLNDFAGSDDDEADIHCGESFANRCLVGDSCEVDSDCESFLCQYSVCVNELVPEATDTDELWNGDETDVDCGGSSAYLCGLGKMCNESAECETGKCEDNVCVDVVASPQSAAPVSDSQKSSANPSPNSTHGLTGSGAFAYGTTVSGGCDQVNSSPSQYLLLMLTGIFAFILLRRKHVSNKQ